MGRPKKPNPERGPLALRVEALVTASHGGNIQDAAGAIGVPNATLARIISGDSENPRLETLRDVQRYYADRGVTLAWLLDG